MTDTETRNESPKERGRRLAAEGFRNGRVYMGLSGGFGISIDAPVDSRAEGREIVEAIRAAWNSGGKEKDQ